MMAATTAASSSTNDSPKISSSSLTNGWPASVRLRCSTTLTRELSLVGSGCRSVWYSALPRRSVVCGACGMCASRSLRSCGGSVEINPAALLQSETSSPDVRLRTSANAVSSISKPAQSQAIVCGARIGTITNWYGLSSNVIVADAAPFFRASAIIAGNGKRRPASRPSSVSAVTLPSRPTRRTAPASTRPA